MIEIISERYHLLKSIGKGGMGEVFLAFDTSCGREIALKRIRSDLINHPQIRHRFLKEAHMTCQLTHPGIIPIYSIEKTKDSAFYTMPFVEGETLKQIIRKTRVQEKKGEKLDHLGGSIPALMRIFMTICQAVAYAHSKGVLHRDLKPENVIIGKYGEVLILDWGLAKSLHSKQEEDISLPPILPLPQNAEITHLGKVVGTVAYMAPERALGGPSTIKTDIYALGVILYQLLTLQSPFKRGSLKEFRKNMAYEKWQDPIALSPYRDIPKVLASAAKICLNPNPSHRYESVAELIYELENYLEGRSEWFHAAELNIKSKADWEFQEHVLIAQHLAITRTTEETEWVNLMISNQSFNGNTRIETSICLGEKGQGIGILLGIPESSERNSMTDGYYLWLGSAHDRSTRLLSSNVEVMQAPDIFLKKNQWIHIRIEKIDKSIHLYFNGILQFSYIAHLPIIGTHIGFLSRDADFEIKPLQVFVGSLNLTVNCLAVPDAFLAHRNFLEALSEYRRIAYSFPDRPEGREAIFRSGLTLIEQAKNSKDKRRLLDLALEEFEKLHQTPGGPLEYLGKALVYEILCENEEEIKCFEIAYRRYPRHPLLPILQEHILSRMHEVSRKERDATYRFLLTARHLPASAIDTHTKRLVTSLQKHWEHLPFIEEYPLKSSSPQTRRIVTPLAFWLAKPYILGEVIDDLLQGDHPSTIELSNASFSLIELGSWKYAEQKLEEIKEKNPAFPHQEIENLSIMIDSHKQPLDQIFQRLSYLFSSKPTFSNMRTLLYLLDRFLDQQRIDLMKSAIQAIEQACLFENRLQFDERIIWAYLLEKDWQKAEEIFKKYPIRLLNQESSPLHFLYGCYVESKEGRQKAKMHFMDLLPVTYPRSWALASHELTDKLLQRGWLEKAFLWEKRKLYAQLFLYYHCAGEEQTSAYFFKLYQQQFINVEL